METFLKQEFDQFIQKLEKTQNFKDFATLDEKDLEALYAHGYFCYENNKIDEAIETFRYLVLQNSLENKYWFCLAASLQQKKNYFLSLRAWAMVCILQPKDPYPHYHAAECYFSINNSAEALKALKMAQKLSSKEKQHPLTQKINLLKTCWEKEV